MRIVAIVVTLTMYLPLLFAADAVTLPQASKAVGEINIVLKHISCHSGPYKPGLPNTIKGFQSLGERIKEQVQPASDYTGDPRTHTSANFWYPDMYLGVVFRNTEPYGNFLESASFSHSRWNTLTPIKIGTSMRDLLAREGITANVPQNATVQLCGAADGAPDCVKVVTQGNTIVKVTYQCYTG